MICRGTRNFVALEESSPNASGVRIPDRRPCFEWAVTARFMTVNLNNSSHAPVRRGCIQHTSECPLIRWCGGAFIQRPWARLLHPALRRCIRTKQPATAETDQRGLESTTRSQGFDGVLNQCEVLLEARAFSLNAQYRELDSRLHVGGCRS